MSTGLRLAATLALLGFVCPAGNAQLPTAPTPHATLDELVKEYRRCGLPVPPPDAELVRMRWGEGVYRYNELSFRYQPPKPGELPHYLIGGAWWEGKYVPSDRFLPSDGVVVVKPTPQALEGHYFRPDEWFCFAAQCKIRGWDDLARAAYAEGRNAMATQKPPDWKPGGVPFGAFHWKPGSATGAFYSTAWLYWHYQLTDKASDRKEVLSRLRALAAENPALLSEQINRGDDFPTLIRDLELTLAPRKSKPGSVEALIDELTDYWGDPGIPSVTLDAHHPGHAAYWKLVELGFDAVPALMEHSWDMRLTRASTRHINEVRPGVLRTGVLRVGVLADWILAGISNGDHEKLSSLPPKEREWWARAQRTGEVVWLLDNVGFEHGDHVLRVIQAKYPDRLAEVYQTLLYKYPDFPATPVTEAILDSKLPLQRKVAMLELGALHKSLDQQWSALWAFSRLDEEWFRVYLLRSLRAIPQEIKSVPYPDHPDLQIISVIRRTADRACWEVLGDITRGATPNIRHRLIDASAGWAFPFPAPNERDPGHRMCLGYLASFLDDADLADDRGYGLQTIRDHATIRLAWELGLNADEWANKSPRELFLLRERVRQLAREELARPPK